MKKLSLLLDSGKNEVYLDGFIRTRTNSEMKVRNAAVDWNFRNITKNFNDTVTNGHVQECYLRRGILDLSHDGGKTRRE